MLLLQALRTCRICGLKALTVKDLEFFKRDKQNQYEHAKICKRCASKETINYLHADPERIIRNRERAKKRRHYDRQRHYDREKSVKYVKAYRKRYPLKTSAHRIAQKRIPLAKICTKCGSTTKVERHHPDYNKKLEVIMLCRSCHREFHGRN